MGEAGENNMATALREFKCSPLYHETLMEQSCKFSVGFKNMHAASLSHATALIGLSYREHENKKRHTPNERRGMHDSEPRYQGIPLEKLRIDRQASRHCIRLLESINF